MSTKEVAMRQSLTCSFCRNKFDAPSAVCPHCGGPVADAGVERLGTQYAGANDNALELDDCDDGELILVPVGSDEAVRSKPAARPPPLPKPIARA
jgi:hypothetical protein